MDFMKVFDQAVREIKREVNLKVLKVPEIQQKVLDATDDAPWGPHGTVLAEIAQATKKYSECHMVMSVLWTRLTETSKNWRLVYKALSVIEYLVAHGSERALDDIMEHTYQISSLASFEYVEPSGKDLGINVRKKSETIVALLNNQDKIQEVRSKAATNRDKYIGLSSSGVPYKSGSASASASFSSSNFRSSDRYGGSGSKGDSDSFRSSYRDWDRHGEEKYKGSAKPTKEPSYHSRKERESATTGASKTLKGTSNSDADASLPSQAASSDKYDEDFDPRGTSTLKSSTGSNQVDLFVTNFIDLLDDPASHPTDNFTSMEKDKPEADLFADASNSTSLTKDGPEVDLFADANNPTSLKEYWPEVDFFADANFVSETPESKVQESSVPQTNVDLFAYQPAPALSTPMDFFAVADPVSQSDNQPSKSDTTSGIVDPFTSVPLNKFDGSDPFGTFPSNTDPLSTMSNNSSSQSENHGNTNATPVESKTSAKKSTFQVNSGIWADSLSRGLIDLNITASKQVILTDAGTVGGLTDGSEDRGRWSSSGYMDQAMGVGLGASRSEFTSPRRSTGSDFFSSLSSQQYQLGALQK